MTVPHGQHRTMAGLLLTAHRIQVGIKPQRRPPSVAEFARMVAAATYDVMRGRMTS
jgi:hypothetical protein